MKYDYLVVGSGLYGAILHMKLKHMASLFW